MFKAIRHLHRDERGMSFVMVGIGLMAFVAASSLAIDVGMMMTARGQAQTAADAGALAGATSLAFNSYTNRSSTGPAVQSAVNAAKANVIMGASGGEIAQTVGPPDVTFPTDPATGLADRVQVTVHRTSESGNPVPTFIAQMFGVPAVNITATAVAEAAPANAMTCVKPFMIPDKWIEKNSNTKFDLGTDIYIGKDPGYTGYTRNDVGTLLMLRAGTGDQINPGFYFSWKMPGDIGGDFYRENIATCNQYVVTVGEIIIQEPGDKTGPTVQGIQDLYNDDPNAYWDDKCLCVKGGSYAPYGKQSPRVFPIPLYDPKYYAEGMLEGRYADFKVANFLGFFALEPQGNKVYGYVVGIIGVVKGDADAAPGDALPRAIRLVK